MKYGYSRHMVHSLKSPHITTYWVTYWRQPWWRWLWSTIYHWYDMRIYKVPGFRFMERWQQDRHAGDIFYIPLSARQDLRCHDLAHKGREVLDEHQVSEQVWRLYRGGEL